MLECEVRRHDSVVAEQGAEVALAAEVRLLLFVEGSLQLFTEHLRRVAPRLLDQSQRDVADPALRSRGPHLLQPLDVAAVAGTSPRVDPAQFRRRPDPLDPDGDRTW